MPDRPSIPPRGKMVQEFSTPNFRDGFFSELVSKESTRYQASYPIRRGTLYSTVVGGDVRVSDSYNPLYFLKESRVGLSDSEVLWVWATDQNAQHSVNSDVTYSGDAIANPVYARVSIERREVYDANPTVATGTALTALIAIKVTAGGTAYAASDVVNIAGGLGAAAELVVNSTGTIIAVIVTNGGTGYDSAALPAITITTSTGSGATLTAVVQIKTAVLTSQRKQELGHDSPFTSQSNDSPYSSEFVRIIRTWEVLPGPWLPYTRWDEQLGAVQGRRRAVLNTNQAATLTATGKTTYEARDGSSIVSWEIEEIWSNGTGSGAGNAAYPTGTADFYDNRRGAVQIVTQLVVATGSEVGSLAVSGGIATQIEYKPYNQFLLQKATETWAVPGPERIKKGFESETGAATREVRQQVVVGTTPIAIAATRTLDSTTMYCVDCEVEPENSVLGELVITYMALPPSRTEKKSVGFQFPARFTYITGWTVPYSGQMPGPPWPGINYTLTAHRTGSKPAEEVISYSTSAPSMPTIWLVTTPGSASRIFPIQQNTIHNGWTLTETPPGQDIEDIDASTPSSYTPGDDLIIQASSQQWNRAFYKKSVVTIEE